MVLLEMEHFGIIRSSSDGGGCQGRGMVDGKVVNDQLAGKEQLQ